MPMPKKATPPRDEWTYINMPKELAAEVDKMVDSRKHGYRSRSDFVSDAVRRRLDELRPLSK